MEKVDLNEGGVELPVLIAHLNGTVPDKAQGFYFAFADAETVTIEDFVGPYPSHRGALDVANFVAHQAIRAQATEDLLSFSRDHH